MTNYTLWGQANPGTTTSGAGNNGTNGLHFTVSAASVLSGIWHYSPSGATQLPTTIGLYTITTLGTSGTLVHSETPTWSGAAGSGWVLANFSSPPSLTSGTAYMAVQFRNDATNRWFDRYAVTWPVTSGIITAPMDESTSALSQGWYNTGTAIAFPTTQTSTAGDNFGMDVSVTVTAHAGAASLSGSGTITPTGNGRSQYTWPFSYDSVWNLPLSAGLQLAPTGISVTSDYSTEAGAVEYCCTDPAQPVVTLTNAMLANSSIGPASVYCYADMAAAGQWNDCSALLGTDGDTVYQGQTLLVSPGGSPQYGGTGDYPVPVVSIKSTGASGSHGGSGLSALGGNLTVADLTGTGPITHSMKVCFNGLLYYSSAGTGYTWPATVADSGYNNPASGNYYGGSNTYIVEGALLALPPGVNLAKYSDPLVRRIATAMQCYGCYIVDNTGSGAGNSDAIIEMNFDAAPYFHGSATFSSDLHQLLEDLHVVTNSASGTPGGGAIGTSRFAAYAPPFNDGTGAPPSVTTVAPVSVVTQSLIDAFPGSSLNAQWGSYGTATVSSGLSLSASTSGSGIYSASGWMLTESCFFAKVAPYTGGTSPYTNIQATAETGNGGGGIEYASGNLSAYWISSGGATTSLSSIAYDPTAHAWWRIRETGGVTYFDTAPDGFTWTNRWSVADPINYNSMQVSVNAGIVSGTPGTTAVSDFNVELSGVAVLSGTGTLAAAAEWFYSSSAPFSFASTPGIAAPGMVTPGTPLALPAVLPLTLAENAVPGAAIPGQAVTGQPLTSVTYDAHAPLSGAGTLSGTSSIFTAGASALSGSGTFTGTGQKQVPGAAALSGSGTITPDGQKTLPGTASMSGSGTFTAAGGLSGTAALTGSGTFTAAGQKAVPGATALTGSGTFTAAGVLAGAASLSGSGLFTAAGQKAVPGASALDGEGVFTALGALAGAASLSGSGTFAATGQKQAAGAAALTGSGTITAAGLLAGAAALSGTGSVTAAGQKTVPGAIALDGEGVLTPDGQKAVPGAMSASGSGTFAAAGQKTVPGILAATGSGTLTAAFIRTHAGFSSLTGSGALTVPPSVTYLAASALDGEGVFTAAGQKQAPGAAAMDGEGVFAATGQKSVPGASAMDGEGSFTVVEGGFTSGVSAMDGEGVLTADGQKSVPGAAPLDGEGVFAAVPTVTLLVSAALSGTGTIVPDGQKTVPGAASLTGSGTITPDGQKTLPGTASMSGSGTMSGAWYLSFPGAAALAGSGTLAAAWLEEFAGLAEMSGSGTFAAAGQKSVPGATAMSGSGTFGAVAVAGYQGAAALSGDGQASASSVRVHAEHSSLTGSGTFTAAGQKSAPGAAATSGSGTLSASWTYTRHFAAPLSGSGSLFAAPAGYISGSASLSGSGSLSGQGLHVARGIAHLAAPASLGSQAVISRTGSAHLHAPGTLAAVAHIPELGAAALTARPVLFASAFNRLGEASLTSSAVLLASATAGPDTEALWAAYMKAKLFANRQWENYRMMRQAGGTDGSAGFLYAKAYDAERDADAAYAAFQDAQRRVYAGVTG